MVKKTTDGGNITRLSTSSDFFSIVIPHFSLDDERGRIRLSYLEQCIESIHKYADMPFELILHDDSAFNGLTYHLKDKTSTIIHNYGKNIGLADSANRATSLAGSKYVLFLNNDIIMNKRCLLDIKNMLDKNYVGFMTFAPGFGENTYLQSNGTKFGIVHGIGGGCLIAFRKETWSEIGGWAQVHDGCSDVAFMVKFWRHGYFRGAIETDVIFRNLSQEDGMRFSLLGPYDSMFPPRIFNVPDSDYETLHQIKKQRYILNEHRLKPEPDLLDMHFWDKTSSEIVGQNLRNINWEHPAAKRFGQAKWKEQVNGDIRGD